ncbi:MAG: hypothetical protein J5973_06880 [Eubacterium sp.]|nr:hypothetical protein [Eubacterium sp.]
MFIIGDDIIQPIGTGGMVFISAATNAGSDAIPETKGEIFYNIRTGFASARDSLTILKTE